MHWQKTYNKLKYICSPDTKNFCVKGTENISITVPLSRFDKGIFYLGGFMETRVAVISIIVENNESVEKLNSLLHEYGEYIIGRMGVPYRQKKINIISIAIDAPQDTISSLSGKIGKLQGVSSKTAYSGVITNEWYN